MERLLDTPPETLWILGGAAILALLLLALLARRLRTSTSASGPTGLPAAPQGLDVLKLRRGEELPDAVLRTGGPRERYFVAELSSGERIALGHTPHQPWVDVFARRRQPGDPDGIHTGPYEAFSYSISEERWSYDAAPPDRREVEATIRGAFADYLKAQGRR